MRRVVAFAGAYVSGLAAAAGLDALGHEWIRSEVLEVAIGVVLGALQAATWPRLHGKSDPRSGAIVGGVAAFVLSRVRGGWLDLGGLGAGPPGELALVVLPLVSVLAVAAVRRRGESSARR